MERNSNQFPSFFKVLTGDFANKLQIPPAFVTKLDGNARQNATLKAKRGKSKWTLKIEQLDEKLYFTGYGWEMFVTDNDLKINDIVLFRLISNTVFEVVTYGANNCEKVMVARESSDSQIKEADDLDSISEKDQKKIMTPQRGRLSLDGYRKEKKLSFFVVINKYRKYFLTIPKSFVHATGLDKKKFIVLTTNQGKVWRVDIKLRKSSNYSGRVDTSSGWRDFCNDNNLALNDSCLFEFVPGSDNVIRVTISSAK